MKSIHLILTGLTIAEVLKALHVQAIPVTYIGTDQNFNILYQVLYSDEKEDIIGVFLNTSTTMKKPNRNLISSLRMRWFNTFHNGGSLSP